MRNPRQTKRLSQLSDDELFFTIAKGISLIIENAQTYMRAAEALVQHAPGRAVEHLRLTAEEEAAKTQPAAVPASAQPDPALQHHIANLERENKLIASAWYDITSRLQSNTVILSRRAEPPKSWLGRQRIAVGQVGGLVSPSLFLFSLL